MRLKKGFVLREVCGERDYGREPQGNRFQKDIVLE